MYTPINPSRPGIRVPVNLNITASAAASGIVSAEASKRFVIMGWNLNVPSGTILVNFTDGTSDLTGKYTITKDSPSTGNVKFSAGAINRGLKIKASANVSNLTGDVWYEEEEQIGPQTANLDETVMGPYPS